jgi:hypothetical protein
LAVLRLITGSNLTGAWTGARSGSRPLEDAVGIGRRAPKIIEPVESIGQQAAE